MWAENNRYPIRYIACKLRDFKGFDENKYNSLLENLPQAPYSGIFKFLRVFQFDPGYRFENFELDGFQVDFNYYYDKTVYPIIIKGKNRGEGVFHRDSDIGKEAREIARRFRIGFCHTYKVVFETYSGEFADIKDYAYIWKANPDNLIEIIKSVKEADETLDRIL